MIRFSVRFSDDSASAAHASRIAQFDFPGDRDTIINFFCSSHEMIFIRLSDGNWTTTNFETMSPLDFCVHIIQF